MTEIIPKGKCCGCGACAQICPQKCIQMIADETGFKYPQINETLCIDCHLCIKICPSATPKTNTNTIQPQCFAGIHRSEKILMESSSGGAFSAIADAFDDDDCTIFGVAYNQDLVVEHRFVENATDIASFKKSKYVQSDTKNTFQEVKNFLLQGKRVMYTGTPCQIAGLKSFLQTDYNNLLCIDLICTGISSPLMFRKSIECIEKKANKKITNNDMRSKIKKDDHWIVINTAIQFDDGTTLSNTDTNRYKACYGQSLGFRESCYECSYAKLPRVSDITIADWWGGVDTIPGMKEDRGTSLIMFNNQKWITLYGKINHTMLLTKVDIKDAVKQNPTLWRPTPRQKRNDDFWEDFTKKPIESVLAKYSLPPLHMRVIYKVAKLFPKAIRDKVKTFIFKV